MIEWLAIPKWDSPPRTLDDWVAGLEVAGHRPEVARDPPDGAWLEIGPLRLRGYVVFEDGAVSAINFELTDPDPGPALRLIEAAAEALGWEIHPDDEAEDDEDE